MAVHGFHHSGRTVSDMEEALRFYRELLGLQLVDDAVLEGEEIAGFLDEEDVVIRAVMLSPDGQPPFLELFEFRSEASEPPSRRQKASDRLSAHPCFRVEDIQGEHKRLSDAGVRFTRPPLQIDGGPFEGEWILYGYDPDGAIVEFWSTPGRA